jgi:hypothetical protein
MVLARCRDGPSELVSEEAFQDNVRICLPRQNAHIEDLRVSASFTGREKIAVLLDTGPGPRARPGQNQVLYPSTLGTSELYQLTNRGSHIAPIGTNIIRPYSILVRVLFLDPQLTET